MIPRIGIAIPRSNSSNAPIISRTRRRIIQEQLRSAQAVTLDRNTIERGVRVRGGGVPEELPIRLAHRARVCVIPRVVRDGVQLAARCEFEDFPSVGEVVVVRHVHGRVGQGEHGVPVVVRGDLYIVWRASRGVRSDGDRGCGDDRCGSCCRGHCHGGHT